MLCLVPMGREGQISQNAASVRFATTRWSAVHSAADAHHPNSEEAWNFLAAHYWFPLYAYARHRGNTPEAAQDLTQSFFETLLKGSLLAKANQARGRFRDLLITAFKNHLLTVRRRDLTAKRGSGEVPVSLQAEDAEQRFEREPPDPGYSPDRMFERRWALQVIDRALDRLEGEVLARGNPALFAELKGFLVGDREAGTYLEVGARVGLNEKAVKAAVHRLRERYRALIRAEISATVGSPAEVEEELRSLMSVLLTA